VRLIDFHTHPWRPGDLAASTVEFIRGISPIVQQHGDALSDPGFAADLLRADGVDHAVLLAEHCPRTSGVVRTETVIDLCRQSNGFFLPFASVDPTSDAAPADFVERAIVDGGGAIAGFSVCAALAVAGAASWVLAVRRIVERPDRSLSPSVRRSTAISLACW
jgi:hypothetical protein